MKLSEKWRYQEAIEVRDKCMASSPNRGAFYHKCRNAYDHGSRDVDQARHNKVKPVTNRVASFLYAPGRTYYWAEFPPDEIEHLDKVESVIDCVQDAWHDTGSDLLAWEAVLSGLTCGCCPVITLPERMTDGTPTLVSRILEPEMFGVFNESVTDLMQQQAICWDAYLTRPEIEIRLTMHPKRVRDKIMADLETVAPEYVETDRVFVSNYQGINSGNVETGIVMSRLGGQYSYNPYVMTPLYRVSNLIFFDDDIGDWNWVLLSASNAIFDLPISEIGVPGILPVTVVRPSPKKNYFWGYSLADDLLLLQDWFSKRVAQMDELFEKILKTPKIGFGVGPMRESKIAALNRPGGYASIPNPAAKIEELKPDIPDSAFTMMNEISDYFIEAGDMRPGMFGRPEPGQRGAEAQSALMRITAAPIAVKALIVEKAIEDWTNQIFRYKRRYDASLYPVYEDDGQFKGRYFRMSEVPEATRIKVDGHSASPVFFEDQKRDAEQLVRHQAMDPESLIEFISPPMKGLLKKRLKRRLMANMVAQAIQQQKQQAKRSGDPEK